MNKKIKKLKKYSKSTLDEENENLDVWQNDAEWPEIVDDEIKHAIESFNPKKTCGSNGLNFKMIPDLFYLLFRKLFQIGHHSDF